MTKNIIFCINKGIRIHKQVDSKRIHKQGEKNWQRNNTYGKQERGFFQF
jgi:hypothetical protein